MIVPEIPLNEKERLAALYSYDILDTLPEKEFDEITKIAAQICGTPIALVSLIDTSRQWFKSHHGLSTSENSRALAFCAHAIHTPNELFIVEDATKDDRFTNNPLTINPPNVVFYAGSPLTTKEGLPLGTLCVIDTIPRELSDNQKESLKALSNHVMSQLEIRLKNKELRLLNDEVLRLNTQLNQFAYRLSHDLKTPVRGIMYVSELLKEEFGATFNSKTVELVDLISSRAAFLDSLIDGMLTFSKTTNDKIIYEDFNLEELIKKTIDTFDFEHKFKIRFKHCDVVVNQSKIGFIQIFQNLIVNSIKFSNQEKCIIDICLKKNKEFYTFIFKDNGPGIKKKYHKKVFELFETLDEKKGNGIGLASVKAIIERLGGTIKIENRINVENGIEFRIKIPVKKN